jgi:hypothetical protein
MGRRRVEIFVRLIGQLVGLFLPFTRYCISPDRWDNLPESVTSLPSIFAYANMMSFSAGPRVWFSIKYDCLKHLLTEYITSPA